MTRRKGADNFNRGLNADLALKPRLEFAINLAKEAGALAAQMRRMGVSIAEHKSSLADIVTEADQAVEQLIRAQITAKFPEDAILGEEGGSTNAGAELLWVVDPIDGTVNYASGFAQYAVSIAVVSEGDTPLSWREEIAVVSAPELAETFWAIRDGGAWLGEQRLQMPAGIPEAGALIATGFGYDPATHEGDLGRLRKIMPLARDIRRMGAASLDLANVAAGRLDGYFERGLQPWDLAAGALLVREAGGQVGGYRNEKASAKMLVAANAALFSSIQSRLDA